MSKADTTDVYLNATWPDIIIISYISKYRIENLMLRIIKCYFKIPNWKTVIVNYLLIIIFANFAVKPKFKYVATTT